MESLNTIHIAFASDDNYSRYLGVCIASILLSAEEDDCFCFYVIDNGISELNKKRLNELQTIREHELFFLKPEMEKFQHLPQCLHLGLSTYLRLLLPELLPERDRLIYLDCDMLATDSLRGLWRAELGGRALGAAEDYVERTKGMESSADRLGTDFYFNAGMLLLDLNQIRERGLFHEVLQWCGSNSQKVKFADQDGLNAVLKEDFQKLPPCWNIQVNPYVHPENLLDEEKRRCVLECRGIVHFITSLKPDKYEFSMPQRELFLEIISKTPWSYCVEKPTLKTRWRKFKNTNPIYQKFRIIERELKKLFSRKK